MDYCAELTENFQVSWAVNDTTNTGVFELCGYTEEGNKYFNAKVVMFFLCDTVRSYNVKSFKECDYMRQNMASRVNH